LLRFAVVIDLNIVINSSNSGACDKLSATLIRTLEKARVDVYDPIWVPPFMIVVILRVFAFLCMELPFEKPKYSLTATRTQPIGRILTRKWKF